MSETQIITREEALALSERQVELIISERWPKLRERVAETIRETAMCGRKNAFIRLSEREMEVGDKLHSLMIDELEKLGYFVESKSDLQRNKCIYIWFEKPESEEVEAQ